MNIGTQLSTLGTGEKFYYTPWFPKGADNAWFTYELIQKVFATGGDFTVEAFTKNREDIGSEGTGVSVTFNALGTTGLFYHGAGTNLKQLVRFKIKVKAGTTPAGPEGVVYRILPPTWYDTAV